MFDFECQMRFWKSATDAAFGYASATMAAVSVMQDRAQDEMAGDARQPASAPFSFDAFNPFALPFQWWNTPQPSSPFLPFMGPFMGGAVPGFASMFSPFAPQPSNIAQAWNPFAVSPAFSPPAAFFDPFGLVNNPLLSNPWISQWQSQWPVQWPSQWAEMMRSYGWAWPQPSWTMWQHPMTAALMSAGMPYSVASPTARANASAMDAADAARDGFNKAFSSYHSDGGHAAAHTTPMPDLMSLMMAPWLAFADPPRPAA